MKDKRVSNKTLTFGVLISAAAVCSPSAYAVDLKKHKAGSMDVSSVITSSFGYGDNVFRGSEVETSSSFLSVQPVVQAVRETSSQKLNLEYKGNGFAFFDSSDDNFFSNKVSGNYLQKINSSSDFNIGASYEDGSTIRGTEITEGTNGSIEGATDFTRKDFSLGYAIGSPKVGPSLELDYNFTDLEFNNFGLINQGRDYALDKFSARLGYQYSVATKLFVDVSQSDFDYDTRAIAFGQELDSTEQALLVGVEWRLSRLTSGELSVGVIDKEFDNFQDPGSLTSWNIQLEWTPTPRDTVSVAGFSRPFEQAGTGTFQDVDQLSVSWEHDISKRFSIVGGVLIGSVDFEDVVRDDDYDALTLGLTYRPTRYSEWALDYEYEEKGSNIQRFNYETNTIMLSYAISL